MRIESIFSLTCKQIILFICILFFLFLNIHTFFLSSRESFASSSELRSLIAQYHAKRDELNAKIEEYKKTGLEKYVLQDEYDNAILEQERLTKQIEKLEQDSLNSDTRLNETKKKHDNIIQNVVQKYTTETNNTNQRVNTQIKDLQSTISDSKRLHNQRQQDHQTFIDSLKDSVKNMS